MTNEPHIDDIRAQRIKATYRELVAAETALEGAMRTIAICKRELTAELREMRKLWPERGPKAKGWGDFLDSIGIPQQRAWDMIHDGESSPQDFTRTVKPGQTNGAAHPDAPHASDGPEPEPEVEVNRDAAGTPEHLTLLLPEVDLDPCSNPFSTVRARRTYSRENGQDGLLLPWSGSMYVNGPFSDLDPWAEKYVAERTAIAAFGFMCNTAPDVGWWKLLVRNGLGFRLDFDKRIEFRPPPGVTYSRNDRPQTLLMDAGFVAQCPKELFELGTLWELSNRA